MTKKYWKVHKNNFNSFASYLRKKYKKFSNITMIEDLNINGMLKNHKLAKSIQELSLNRFKTILTYKAEWYGREIIQVSRWFASSKLCNYCGYKNNKLELKDRSWICPKCNSVLDRDLNAAINIRNEGYKIKIGLSSPELTHQESKSLDPRRMMKQNVKLNNVTI
jgi:putative transposase